MTEDAIREVIGDDAATLLARVREDLSELVAVADRLAPGSTSASHAALVRAHVDEFFLLVVIGEVKSGKSSFINALLGEDLQAEGPLPLTDRIWVLTHGDAPGERLREEFVHEKQHPNELLRLFHIVDTPGTNSIVRRHQDITESFIPRADLTLFVTSIDRPFSESEHQFLDYVSDRWRRKVLFVLTKIDAHERADVAPVVAFIKENCRKFYDFEPEVFPVSSKQYRAALASGDDSSLRESGIPALLDYLRSSLAEAERVQLKLVSPIKAGLSILEDLAATTSARRGTLEQDFQSLTDLDKQLTQSSKELTERYHVYVVELYDELREFERRGRNFFESTLRVQNMGLLRNPETFQRRFEKEVVLDLKDRIHDSMHKATDWLMKEQIALFERSLRFLGDHLTLDAYEDRIAAPDPKSQTFEYNREALVKSIQASFRREIERFNLEGECNRVMEAAYRGILQQVGLQAGAIGLGALLVTILSGAALDVTGVLTAGVIFASGFVILPRRKRRLLREFSEKVDQLIVDFRRALRQHFDAEIEHASGRLRAAYDPYMSFYRAEVGDLTQSATRQTALRQALLESAHAASQLAPTTPSPSAEEPGAEPPVEAAVEPGVGPDDEPHPEAGGDPPHDPGDGTPPSTDLPR